MRSDPFLRVEEVSKRYPRRRFPGRRTPDGVFSQNEENRRPPKTFSTLLGLRPDIAIRKTAPSAHSSVAGYRAGAPSGAGGSGSAASAQRHPAGDLDETPPALQRVSFTLDRGRLMGLVGASGSGKSTLARALALIEPPDSGRILLEGRDLWAAGRSERTGLHARIQLIVQQPAATLNPRFTAEEIVSEPLAIQQRGTAPERRRAAARWMEMMGLSTAALDRRAWEFSGGERQRLAIARALILEPSLLILDESFAGLDLSVEGQIVRLLRELQRERGLTCILITHDLALAASLADEIAVLDGGRIVERGAAAEVLAHPHDSRTRELLDAALALALEDPAAGGAA